MSTVLSTSPREAVLRLRDALDLVRSVDVSGLSEEDMVGFWREVDTTLTSTAAVVDHVMINTAETRGLAALFGHRDVKSLMIELLRVHPAEAASRIAAARALGSRTSLTGEVLEPIYPATAAAVAAGEISQRHAMIIVNTVEKLPVEIRAVLDRTVEGLLLETARVQNPQTLTRHAEDLRHAVDQDGQYDELAHRHRTRGVTLHRRGDGSASISGDLTAECTELVDVLMDSLAKPRPAEDGTRDPRSADQRRHDALLDGLQRLLGNGLLPDAGGCRATIVLTMTADDFAANTGTARTGHGVTIPVDIAKRWAGPEARAILVLLSATRAITGYSTVQRLFTEQQRLAMLARDGGCSFPGCTAPPGWCDAHHVTDYQHTRRTSVDDGTLVCGPHHDTFEKLGWHSTTLNGRPHWVPPTRLDPDRIPRRNTTREPIPPPFA